MNLARVDQITKAVLYEGYMLYPYRPSSVKNQQRWNFGVVYPQAYSEAQSDGEATGLQTECLVCGSASTVVEVNLRFLHLQTRRRRQSSPATTGSLPNCWQEAVERDVRVPEVSLEQLCFQSATLSFRFPSQTQVDPEHDAGAKVGAIVDCRQETVEGMVDISARQVGDGLFTTRVLVRNVVSVEDDLCRDEALMHSLVSAHLVLGVQRGEFVSLLEPSTELQGLAAQCQNVGVWPVLVGEQGQRDTLLASPIILYDYPQIAPESAGDLFDGTEIDEILSLRIMTLTDEEKNEIRQSDDRARQILERTDAMPAEQFMKLHGAMRGMRPLKEENP